MSRKKADPVDATFDLWRNLDTDQQKRFEDQKRGYQQAMGVVAAPAPRVRQRKTKMNRANGAESTIEAEICGGCRMPLQVCQC